MRKIHLSSYYMAPCMTELGHYVRERRLALGISQAQFAIQCKLTRGQMSRIETGATEYLDDKLLITIATALGCDLEELHQYASVKPVNSPTTEFGKCVRARREALGMTIEDFAEKLEMTLQQARRLEIRKSPSIRYNLMNKLATTLDITPSDLIKFVGIQEKETTSELGQLIRTRRKELGLSVVVLAKKANVTPQFVSLIELGRSRLSATSGTMAQFAHVLHLDVDELKKIRQPAKQIKQKKRVNRVEERLTPLGKFIFERRSELGITQTELGYRIGRRDGSVISLIERGTYPLREKMAIKLAQVLKCEIPTEFISPENKQVRKSVTVHREGVGKFIYERRLELGLDQGGLADRIGRRDRSAISEIELGKRLPGKKMIARLAQALECEIPTEFMSTEEQCTDQSSQADKRDVSPTTCVSLSDKHFADLVLIKKLSGVQTDSGIVEKALEILKVLLERRNDGYTIRLHKDNITMELKFPR